MIGYIKAVIFFEGLTATSGRNLAPIRPHSLPHRLATITDGVAGWFPGPTAASRRPARRRAVSRRSVEAPHELPQYHLHVDGRDRGHHQEIHGGAREALHEAMVERIARGEVGGEELHHQATHIMHSGTRGEVSKKARPSVLGGRTRSSTRTSSRRRCRPRLGGFLNDDARAARRWLLTDPMARSQTGPRDR